MCGHSWPGTALQCGHGNSMVCFIMAGTPLDSVLILSTIYERKIHKQNQGPLNQPCLLFFRSTTYAVTTRRISSHPHFASDEIVRPIQMEGRGYSRAGDYFPLAYFPNFLGGEIDAFVCLFVAFASRIK